MKILALLFAFFRFGGLDFASMGAGLFGGIHGMANAQSIPHANFNVYGNPQAADSIFQQQMARMNALDNRNADTLDPIYRYAMEHMNSIGTGELIPAGSKAGGQYGDLASLSQMYSGMLGDQAVQQFGAGADIYNLGRDPQNQLHDFMQQQNVDESRAASSARGIGMGANAAGLENDATRKFEMDWQNNLLGRAATGLRGMDQANYLGGLDLSGSMNMGAMAPDYTMASAMAPIAGQQAAYGLPAEWANMFAQSEAQGILGPQANLMSGVLPYMAGGSQAQQAQFGGNLNAVNAKNAMQQQSQFGLWGGGQSSTPFMGGNQSGAGNPMNWMGMMGGFGGM